VRKVDGEAQMPLPLPAAPKLLLQARQLSPNVAARLNDMGIQVKRRQKPVQRVRLDGLRLGLLEPGENGARHFGLVGELLLRQALSQTRLLDQPAALLRQHRRLDVLYSGRRAF
jgi:hypothetical protein